MIVKSYITILDVYFKYRHWFHSNIIDGETQNSMEKNWLEKHQKYLWQPKWKEKNENGCISFNFSSSVDLLYEYMEFRLSCLKKKKEKRNP